MEKLLLTVEETAEVLGLSRRTVYLLVSARTLPSVKIGGSRRVSTDAVRAYVAQLSAPGAS